MDVTKHSSSILSGLALLTAGASAIYSNKRINEMETVLVEMKIQTDAQTKIVAVHGSDLASIKSHVEQLAGMSHHAQKDIGSISNDIKDIQDIQVQVDEDREVLNEWSATVTTDIKSIRPDSVLEDIFLGDEKPVQRRKRSRASSARSKPYPQQQHRNEPRSQQRHDIGDHLSHSSHDDADNIATFRGKK